MRRLLPLLFFVTNAAWGQTSQCLIEFATLAADADDAEPLVVDTYNKLLDQLGAKLPPEAYQKIAEGKDPFAVPEELGTEGRALSRRLKEFREMLKKKGWNTPAIQEQLVTGLVARSSSLREVEVRRDRIIEDGFSDHQIKFPFPAAIAVSPDGKFVLGVAYKSKHREGGYYVYDTATRAVRTFSDAVLTGLGEPQFSPDGKSVMLADGTRRIHVYPFADGKLVPDQAKIVARPSTMAANNWFTDMHRGDNPNRIIAFDSSLRPEGNIFDLRENRRIELQLKPYLGWNKPYGIPDRGVVPGTDDVWLLVQNEGKSAFHRVSVDQNGNLALVNKREWDSFEENYAVYLPDGKTIVLSSPNTIGLLREGDTVPQKVYQPKSASDPQPELRQVVPHPDGKLIAALVQEGKKSRVEWLDAGTGKLVDSFELEFSSVGGQNLKIEVAADGKALYVSDKNAVWHALNYKERLKPETLAK